MTMPRSIEEILNQADQLSDRFENHEPHAESITDAAALSALRNAFLDRAAAERRVADSVLVARAGGHPWAVIGSMVGTSGEAARQRYGHTISKQ
jgi:hypothetical protein